MKKQEIKRIVYEDTWSPQIPQTIEWETFKREAEERIKYSIERGYSNPMVRYGNSWGDQELEIFLTKVETDESYNKRVKTEEEKNAKRNEARVRKLKLEAKELGLKVVDVGN